MIQIIAFPPEQALIDDPDEILAETHDEVSAEEIGAALALAGYRCNVWKGDQLLHEFFPTE